MELKDHPTGPESKFDEDKCREKAKQNAEKIGELQVRLYAEEKQSLLVVFQGMDAAGKDGAIKKVFIDVNPMGCHVVCFKKPTPKEYAHDFLWRVHQHTPPYGMIHVFNRSHYEDIVVPTVLNIYDKKFINKRFDQINDFESMLEENDTHVLKFFLHVSKDQQKERLEERMNVRSKYWKHKDADWEVRDRWDDYLDIYDKVFKKCDKVPWHIIPSDKNWYKEMLVSEIVLKKLEEMDPQYPDLITNMKPT